MFSPAPLLLDSSYPLDRIMADYMKANSPIAPALEGRIVNCNTTAADAMCPAVLLPPAPPAAKNFQLQILHINDNHGRFEPADRSFGPCTDPAACFGGFARQATAIKAAKAAAAANGIDTLVLHAGEYETLAEFLPHMMPRQAARPAQWP